MLSQSGWRKNGSEHFCEVLPLLTLPILINCQRASEVGKKYHNSHTLRYEVVRKLKTLDLFEYRDLEKEKKHMAL